MRLWDLTRAAMNERLCRDCTQDQFNSAPVDFTMTLRLFCACSAESLLSFPFFLNFSMVIACVYTAISSWNLDFNYIDVYLIEFLLWITRCDYIELISLCDIIKTITTLCSESLIPQYREIACYYLPVGNSNIIINVYSSESQINRKSVCLYNYARAYKFS